jgi:hypothetical protein
MAKCPKFERNLAKCNCSYGGCPTKGTCCDCLHKHLAMKQLPACCFPDDVEATYDRSFQAFIRAWS